MGGYEVGFKSAERNYKKAIAKAMVMHKGYKTATIVKTMAENEPHVIEQAVLLEQAEVLLIMGKAEDARRYRILHANYFEKVKIADICEDENIDRITYYRDNRESSEMLSALIFGADGLSAMRQRGN